MTRKLGAFATDLSEEEHEKVAQLKEEVKGHIKVREGGRGGGAVRSGRGWRTPGDPYDAAPPVAVGRGPGLLHAGHVRALPTGARMECA